MTINEIYAIIIAAAPAITATIGIIFAVIKGIRNSKDVGKEMKEAFNEMREEVLATKEYEELKKQFRIVNEQNIALKNKLNELLMKIDHIQRED